jgi:hypothetical protein
MLTQVFTHNLLITLQLQILSFSFIFKILSTKVRKKHTSELSLRIYHTTFFIYKVDPNHEVILQRNLLYVFYITFNHLKSHDGVRLVSAPRSINCVNE